MARARSRAASASSDAIFLEQDQGEVVEGVSEIRCIAWIPFEDRNRAFEHRPRPFEVAALVERPAEGGEGQTHLPRLGAEAALADGERPLEEGHRRLGVSLVRPPRRRGWTGSGRPRRSPDRRSFPGWQGRVRAPAAPPPDHRARSKDTAEIVEQSGDIRVLRSQSDLEDGEGPLGQQQGLQVVPLPPHHPGEVVENGRHLNVVGSERPFEDPDRPAAPLLGRHQVAFGGVDLGQHVTGQSPRRRRRRRERWSARREADRGRGARGRGL